MRIGLRAYGGRVCANLPWMLVLPFKPLGNEFEDDRNDEG
jgi:hypothetical protein